MILGSRRLVIAIVIGAGAVWLAFTAAVIALTARVETFGVHPLYLLGLATLVAVFVSATVLGVGHQLLGAIQRQDHPKANGDHPCYAEGYVDGLAREPLPPPVTVMRSHSMRKPTGRR
jgi:hypothetical protein